MSIREETIHQRFSGWLGRYSPPRYLAGKDEAMQAEANDMLRTILRYAPGDGYEGWLEDMLGRLAEGMTTRTWPAPGELAKACKAASAARQSRQHADGGGDEQAVNMLAQWFAKFGDEMPGMGAASRTAALIGRGVFENEREARFKGFTLGPDQERRAHEQPMGRDEREHHERVMEKLTAIRREREQAIEGGSPHQNSPGSEDWRAA
ncbi:hypothetical protein C2I36_09540 [Rhodobacteraceae bacterium WD3A24]|nr:hypothetical protein C2I36_09540 [Rhodobacteraceae bacterium WD3A24]